MLRALFTFAAFVTGSMMKGFPGHLVLLVFRILNSSIYITPPVAAVSFVTSRRRRLVAGLIPGAAETAGLVSTGLCRH